MDYFGILTAAAKTLWKHKTIYAFLLVFTSIPMVGPLLFMGVFAFSMDMDHPERWFNVMNQPFSGSNLPVMVGLIGIYLLFMLLSFFCTIISYIGVLKGAAISERSAEPISFSMLWQVSLKYFWRVAAVFVAIGIIVFALLLIMIVPVTFLAPVFMLAFCVLIPVFLAGRVMVEMLVAAIIDDDLNLVYGLSRFWQIVQNQVGPLALMMLLLVVIDVVAYLILFFPISIIQQVVMQFLVLIPARQNTSTMLPGDLFRWVMLFQLLSYPILIILQTIVTAFHLAAVSVFYVRIPANPVPAERPVDAAAAG